MSALERIAELHIELISHGVTVPYCAQCYWPWPCPTRRLCDERGAEALTDRDAARADADRLAAAAVAYINAIEADTDDTEHEAVGVAWDALDAALAAHDAARAKEGL